MAQFDQWIAQVKTLLQNMNPKQRWILAGAAVVTALTLYGFVRALSHPEYKPLFTNMEPGDAQSLGTRLAAKNLQYEISADGKTISVPADKLDSSRLEIASEGMPKSGRLGFELFDKTSWGQTEFDEKVNYQRALEGELERTVQTLRDVESARVHLVLPNDSAFVDRERSAKASVILKLKNGRLPEDTRVAIARLVAGAVDQLAPESVTVIDADSNRPLGMARQSGAEGLEQQLTDRLLATVSPVVGQDRVRASVNVEYDSSTSDEQQETYDPKSAVATSVQRSEERLGAGNLSGVPGTASNIPGDKSGAPTTVTTSNDAQYSRSESEVYAVNRVLRHTTQPAGRIRRITAALLVDDAFETVQESGKSVQKARKRSADELKQLEELAKAAIGVDPSRNDVISVQNISFEHSVEPAPVLETKITKVTRILHDWSSIVRYGSLILLFLLAYLLMLRPVKKHAILALKEATVRKEAVALPGDPLLNAQLLPEQKAALLKQRFLDQARTQPAEAGRLLQTLIHEESR